MHTALYPLAVRGERQRQGLSGGDLECPSDKAYRASVITLGQAAQSRARGGSHSGKGLERDSLGGIDARMRPPRSGFAPMKLRPQFACFGLILLPALCLGQSIFDGTWRPDPQKPSPDQPPDEVILMSAQYECRSCKPAYKIAADGKDHEIKNNSYYDSLSVSIVDDHTVVKTAKKGGTTVANIKETVSIDGGSRTQVQSVVGMAPRSVEFARTFSRISPGPSGSHALSGTWRELQADLVNHEEDTTYKIHNNTLDMSDGFGRSFSARLDGAEASYKGDPHFTSVSVKMVDSRTIEESDLKDGKIVKICTWTIRPDGRTMHVRFDDTKGHIQEQDGRRVR